MVSFTPQMLYPQGKRPLYPLNRSLDDRRKRKFLTLPGLELRPLDSPAHSQSVYGLHVSYYMWFNTLENKLIKEINIVKILIKQTIWSSKDLVTSVDVKQLKLEVKHDL
jgi:hypothetical protein